MSIETVLLIRSDLTAEDIHDILEFVDENEDLLEAVNKFYPFNQGTDRCTLLPALWNWRRWINAPELLSRL